MFTGVLQALGQALAFFYSLIPSYGIAIILLTVMVRLVLLPLTIKQTRSLQAMQKIQPEMKRLQAKHKGDRQKLNEEMMKLYKEHQVNPLGGCLPMVLQLPVFYALFKVLADCAKLKAGTRQCMPGFAGIKYLPAGSALVEAIRTGQAAFLGMDLGLAPSEALRSQGLGGALPFYVLVALMGITTWYQSKQTAAAQPVGQAQQMLVMMKVMPLLLAFFSLNFPAGVTIYWVASNLWTIGQQHVLVTRKLGVPSESAGSGDGAGPSRAGGKQATPKDGAGPSRAGGKQATPKDGAGPSRAGGKQAGGRAGQAKPKGSGARRKSGRR